MYLHYSYVIEQIFRETSENLFVQTLSRNYLFFINQNQPVLLKKYKELQENGNGIEKPRRHIHRWQIRYSIIVLLTILLLATTYLQ